MLAANSSDTRAGRFTATSNSGKSFPAYFNQSRLPPRSWSRSRFIDTSLHSLQANPVCFGRMKRLRSKKLNGFEKMDFNRKKTAEYTELAYREAVSKLKYLLAESYGPKTILGISECGEDVDDRSIISDGSRTKDGPINIRPYARSYFTAPKKIQGSKALNNLTLSAADLQSVPPELTSFIERQEEYIQQLERESQYCRDELTSLLRKVREVVAENEALHNKNKAGFLKSALDEHSSLNGETCEGNKESPDAESFDRKRKPRVLDAPSSIVLESRISELEAQLTQCRLELRKAHEENETNLKRLSENCAGVASPESKLQLEEAIRARCKAESKLEDAQKALSSARDREDEAVSRAKRATESIQQVEFEKNQCEAEIRRLKGDLERQLEKLRDAAQDANRRIADERQQAERRYSQQVEQMSADVANHWDAANKSQLESEKQRRELSDLRRDVSQKQSFIDNLKKELQNKISTLQSELNQTIVEKDATEQEILGIKLAAERNERQARQEQGRLQSEINSYKQRLERTDGDLVHCRRENLRLSEQISSLEKELSMARGTNDNNQAEKTSTKTDNPKELTSMIMDLETKHAATVAGLEDVLNNQATIVSQLTAECQSLTQRLEANTRKHKEEIASLQSNINYLTHIIQKPAEQPKGEETVNEISQESVPNENYAIPTEFTTDPKEPEELSDILEEYTQEPKHSNDFTPNDHEMINEIENPSNDQLPQVQQSEESYESQHTDAPPTEVENLDAYVSEEQYNQSQYEQYDAFDSENGIPLDNTDEQQIEHFDPQLQQENTDMNPCETAP